MLASTPLSTKIIELIANQFCRPTVLWVLKVFTSFRFCRSSSPCYVCGAYEILFHPESVSLPNLYVCEKGHMSMPCSFLWGNDKNFGRDIILGTYVEFSNYDSGDIKIMNRQGWVTFPQDLMDEVHQGIRSMVSKVINLNSG